MNLLFILLLSAQAFAGLCADRIAPDYPYELPRWQFKGDPDFLRIASLLPLKNDAEVHAYLKFTLSTFEARAHGESIRDLSGPLVQREADRLLKHLRRTAAAWERDNAYLVGDVRRVFRQRSGHAHITYRVLAQSFGYLMNQRRSIRWEALFRFTWLAALLEDQSRANYGLGYQPPTVAGHFAIDVGDEDESIRDYAHRAATDDAAATALPALERLVTEADRQFMEQGLITVPVARLPSEFERLALAFLPLQWVSVTPMEARAPQDYHRELSLQNAGYDTRGLRSRSPLDWTLTLNEAWRTWYALLGGNGTEDLPPYKTNAARAILFTLRYGGLEDVKTPDWSDPPALLRFLVHDVAFTSDWDLKRSVLDYFWFPKPHLRGFYGEKSSTYLDFRDTVEALDVLVTRVLPPGLAGLRDRQLVDYIAKHRDRVVSDMFDVYALKH